MKLLMTLVIATAMSPLPALATATQPSSERRALQFVFVKGEAGEVPIPLSEPSVTYRVRPLDGEGPSFNAYGFANDWLDNLATQLPLTSTHHPTADLRAWLESSSCASTELSLADRAATAEDLGRLATVLLLAGGVMPLVLVPIDHPQSGTAALVSMSMLLGGLGAIWFAGEASSRSVDHLGRAVWRWNHGE